MATAKKPTKKPAAAPAQPDTVPVEGVASAVTSAVTPVAPPQPDAAGVGIKSHLHIAARVDGFRRAGRAWPASGTTIARADLTPEQVDSLLSEPELVVTEADAE